jgi:hypothetical protein
MPLPKFALPTITGLSLFIAGVAGGYLSAPATTAENSHGVVTGGKPLMGDLGTLIVPIWQHGKVVAFLAAEMKLELSGGSNPDVLLPPVRDRLLAALYERGAKGQLDPSNIQPATFKADVLQLASEATGGRVTAVELVRLVHQENRRV